ncbi:MAG TPA: 16S rRNA (cytidine(1402)-2'-O)-methyltransferase [Actinomycetota bacterium]|jgi:16S rRNA (cytidine1402-2'-O)-methyltransferase
MSGTLFVVGTPIGNLEDITDRARRVLASVDLIAAEDTRRTGRLLKHLGIKAPLVSFFEGNETQRVPELIRSLRDGADVAVVSDAGMPSVSDPGYRLVAACVDEGIAVDVAPGPSAVTAALVISGLPTDRFVFEGFLPRSGRAREERLAAMVTEPRTIVLFESANRLDATLEHLRERCGAKRRIAVVRELTKQHQEVARGSIGEVSEKLGDRSLKGEIVLVIDGAPSGLEAGDEEKAVETAERLVSQGARKREAARRAAELTGVAANRIYERLTGHTAEAGSIRSATGRRADSSE